MGYKWKHVCSLKWMRARQEFLTASDVRELVPFTATGRSRKVTDESYLKVLARKKVMITEADCESFGAAARGHILEPYAIKKFNEFSGLSSNYIHWDDVILAKARYGLAFSPDATNVPMPDDFVQVSSSVKGLSRIAEVKSYSPERHLMAGFTGKFELEERWQLAAAMAVDSRIETARLLFYNPSMDDNQMFSCVFDRSELEKEIEIVLDVEDKWLRFLKRKRVPHMLSINGTGFEEEEIIKFLESTTVNPV